MLACSAAGTAAPGELEAGLAALAAGDHAGARARLEPLAAQGEALAAAALAVLHGPAATDAADAEAARRWYETAAAGGVVEAGHDLAALHYRHGSDPAQAARWWQRGAEAGDPASQYNLALLYLRGEGVAADRNQARAWFARAARQDLAPAQYALGALILADAGPGDAGALDEALGWFRAASAAGYAPAAHNLAVLESGRDTSAQAAPAGADRAPAPMADAPVGTGAGPAVRGSDWIRGQDPAHYTVQVATGDDERALLAFLVRHGLSEDAAYFGFDAAAGRRYSAIVGAFAEYTAARAALEQLPEPAKQTGPWIRRFAELHAQLGAH